MSNQPHTLWDAWTPQPSDIQLLPIVKQAFIDNKYKARRFVFTNEVARMMAGLIKDHPNTFIDNVQFALPPYPVTYIEFPTGIFLDTIGQRMNIETQLKETSFLMNNPNNLKDKKAGFLIIGRTCYTITESEAGSIYLSPMVYKFYFEGTVESVSFKGLQPIVVSTHFVADDHPSLVGFASREDATEWWQLAQILGSTLTNPKLDLNIDQANFLLLNKLAVEPKALNFFEDKLGKEKANRLVMDGSMGDMRTILMCLLWLNQPRLVNIETKPVSRGWYNGKNRAYQAYHLVDLKKEVTIRKALGKLREHSKHRRHEVQAYFRNFDKHPGCEHEWPLYPDDGGKWTCPKCGQWRVRVKEHVRGDASLGWVNKDYLVR